MEAHFDLHHMSIILTYTRTSKNGLSTFIVLIHQQMFLKGQNNEKNVVCFITHKNELLLSG